MTPPSKEPNNNPRITNKQVYDLLNELKMEIAVINNKLDYEINKNDKMLNDHETRLRAVETLVIKASIISGVVSTIGTTVIGGLLFAFFSGKL